MDMAEETRAKVALMRELGIVEIETTSGHVRRLKITDAPSDGVPVAAPAPQPAPKPEPDPELARAAAVAKEEADRAKRERTKFGAGK